MLVAMNGRFWSALRSFVAGLIALQLALPPQPVAAGASRIQAFVPGNTATIAASTTAFFAGDTITLSGTLTAVAAGAAFTLNFGDGTSAVLPAPASVGVASPYSVTHQYTRTGVATPTVTSGAATLATTSVNIAAGSIAAPGVAAVMTIAAPFTVTATSAAPGVGLPGGNFTITWGDGSANTTAAVASPLQVDHVYTNAGTYTVTLISPLGAVISTTTATVVPLSLAVSANPNPVQAGSSTALTFSVPSPTPLRAPPTVNVAFGDGQTTTYPYTTAVTVINHAYANPGTYTVTATANTTRLASTTVTAVTSTFAITTNPNPSLVNGSVTISTTATVPAGAMPPQTLSLDYGDNSTATLIPFTSATYTHAYATRGTYNVRAIIATTGQQFASAMQMVLAPGATLTATNGTTGQPITINVGVTALGSLAGPNLVVNFGDGSATQTIPYASTTLTHAYATAGTYTITVGPAPINGVALPSYATTTTTITNPTVTIATAPNPQLVGTAVTATITAMANFTTTPPPIVVDFGDGSATQTIPFASTTLTHSYMTAGTYTVAIRSTTGGQLASTTQRIVAPSATLSVMPNPATAGTPVQVALGVGALGGPTGPNLVINFGDGTAASTVPYAGATIPHTYANGGTYTITATPVGGTASLATTSVTVNVTLAATITSSQNPALAASMVSFTVTATSSATPYQVNFGDGTSTMVTFNAAGSVSPPAIVTHAYSNAGTYTVTVTNGGTTYATLSQSIVAPGATLSAAPNPVTVGSPVTASYTVTPLAGLTGPTLSVNFGDGTAAQTVPYQTGTLAHTYGTPGTFTISIGAVGGATYAQTTVTAAAPANYTLASSQNPALAGTTVIFTANSSTGVLNGFTIDFGDGSSQPLVSVTSLRHSYAAPGTFTVKLIGATGATSATLTQTIVAPSATIQAAPNPTQVGTPIVFTLGVGSLSGLAGPNLIVDFGDQSPAQTVAYAATTLSHAYATGGMYTVNVRTSATGPVLASVNVTVTAATSVMLATTPNPSLAGAPVSIAVTASGTGPATLSIAFGDGQTQTIPFASATLSHVYAAAGTYQVTAAATAGGAPLFTIAQTVVAPSATLVPSQNPGLAGSPVSFALGVGSLGAAAPPTLTINYGDGSVPQTTPYAAATLTHTYTTPGVYTAVVTAAGSAAPLVTVSETILSPMVTLAATPNPQFAGQALNVALTVNAIPTGIAPSLVINFGDGSAPTTTGFASGTFAHTYLVAGAYTVTASTPGGAPLFSLPVRIVTPTATLSATPNPVLAGANVSLALSVGSLFGLTGPNLVVNYGDGTAPQTVPYAVTTLTHAYRTAGTYPVSVVAVGSTTLLASATVTVMAPNATLNISPNPQLAGSPVTIAVTATSLAVSAPNLTLDFGDGSATQSIPYGSTTVSHTYTTTGTFTVRASDPTGAVNATASVQIVAPSATLLVAPNPVMVGKSTGVTVMVGNLGTLPVPSPLTVNFGDGNTQQIAYATATIQHTYTAVGTYTIQVSGPVTTNALARGLTRIGTSADVIFATSTVSVVAQTQALRVMAPTVSTGSPAQIMVTLIPPGGFSANPVQLLYGDGTSTTVRATGLYPHAYGQPGVYTVSLVSLTNGMTLATSQLTVNGITPRVPIGQIYGTTFTLSPILAGDETTVLVQFSIAVPTLSSVADPIEAYVDLLTTKGKLVRRSDLFEILPGQYSGPGVKTVKIPYSTPLDAAGTYLVKVTLLSAQGGTIVTGPPATLIIIGGPDPLPKVQTDFHSSGAIEVGPHAGEPGITFDPSIANALIFPTYSVGITGLFDPVSRRSDPVFTLKSGAQQVVRGPDATPPPANPSASPAPAVGATEPAGPMPTPPGPLAGGAISGSSTFLGSLNKQTPPPSPRPTPAAAASAPAVPAAGAATAAPTGASGPSGSAAAGQPAANPAPGGPSTSSPGAAEPATSATPLAQTSSPLPQTAPADTSPQAAPPSPSHPYQGVYGRGQATLPTLLGGGTTLRGLDIVDSAGDGPTTYQVGYGYTSLGTPTTSAERGSIADIARTFGNGGIARVAYFGRQDDPVTYASTPTGTGPLTADSEVLEFTSPTLGPLSFTATGAISEAHSLIQAYRVDDASDKFTLAFTKPTYNFTFDYHNAGGLFAVGGGSSATSDRVGFASASTIQLYTVASLALGYTKDETRSAFSRQSDAFVTLNVTLPAQNTLQLGVRRDTQRTPTSDTDNDTANFNLGGKLGIATVSMSGSLTAMRDMLDAANGSTTRTASLQYAVQQNAHALGIGINATDLSGMSQNSTIGESLTYGFPFLGHIVNGALVHGVELQLSATNTTTHAPFMGTVDQALSAIFSYHLTQHLALGVRNEYTWHRDAQNLGNTKASALRLRLDLTQ